jgi:protein farnesyltransferase/geranylgeranyltransferase type-1 subunit alpha|uniref:Protein farnesyltransferase/geranylgeranyltransferase type-1 subunit alpha n=1 Tax=Eutreptiella gymnastica TaxID=73025 RepID=A0A7S4GJI2_9EUGL
MASHASAKTVEPVVEDKDAADECPAWIPYDQRPDWADVMAVPQDDGPHNVVRIDYTPEFSSTMDYFRGIMARGEKSMRALAITAEASRLNPGNYVAWWYRRQCLLALGCDFQEELEWMRPQLMACPKNYQMWFHRRELIIHDPNRDIVQEKALIDAALDDDSKNYHSWCHRRWLVQTYGAYDGELDWVADMLQIDVRNNSAWNYRYFLMDCHILKVLEGEERTQVLHREFQWAMQAIEAAPNNESPHNYLFGLSSLLLDAALILYLKNLIKAMVDLGTAQPNCVFARTTLFQCLDKLGSIAETTTGLDSATVQWLGSKVENYQHAVAVAKELQTMDRIRKKYWWYQQRRLEQELQESGSADVLVEPPECVSGATKSSVSA